MKDSEYQAYMLLSSLDSYRNRIENAIRTAKDALSTCKKAAVSFSGGKDSIVMLDILSRAGFRGDLIFFKYGVGAVPSENAFDEVMNLIAKYADDYRCRLHVVECYGASNVWEDCGRFTFKPENPREKKFFKKVSEDFAQKASAWNMLNDIDLQFIGMCKHESRARKIMLSVKGSLYTVKSGERRCCILADLTPADIWAYIVSRELPYLSIYDYPLLSRERIRNECTMCYNEAIIRNGVLTHYRALYPDYIAEVEKRWGRIG